MSKSIGYKVKCTATPRHVQGDMSCIVRKSTVVFEQVRCKPSCTSTEDGLEAGNFRFRKEEEFSCAKLLSVVSYRKHLQTKERDKQLTDDKNFTVYYEYSCKGADHLVTGKLICTVVFTYADRLFSCAAAQILLIWT